MTELPGIKKPIPAEALSPGQFIVEELAARGWTIVDLATRMDGDAILNRHQIEALINTPDRTMTLNEGTAAGLGKAFGLRPEFFISLDEAWRRRMHWGSRPDIRRQRDSGE